VTCLFHIAQNEQQFAEDQWPVGFTLHTMNSSLLGVSDMSVTIAQNEEQIPEVQWPVCFTLRRMNSSRLGASDLSVSHCTECTAVCWLSVTCPFYNSQNELKFAGGQWPVCFKLHTMNTSLLMVSDPSVSHCTEWTAVRWGSVTWLFHIAQNDQQSAGGQWPVCFTLHKMNNSLLRVSDLSVSHCTESTAVCWGSVNCLFHISQNE